RITALIIEICGGANTKVGPIDDHIVNLPARLPVKMRVARANKVIGVPLSTQQISEIFTRLHLPFSEENGVFLVTPPSYRFDLEIEEDLIEEVARIYGFDNIPAQAPIAPNHMRIPPENRRAQFALRHRMADLGYQEVINFSFIDEAQELDFAGNSAPIRLLNPIASQMNVMRSNLIAGLVANLRHNLNRKINRVRVFEVGAVYLRDADAQDGPLAVAGFQQPKHLGALAYGQALDEQWGAASRNVDFFDVKADVEAMFAPKQLRFSRFEHPALHPGRSAQVELDGKAIGFIGELHPRWQQKYELPLAPVVFELLVDALQQRDLPSYQEISKFPAVMRDIALVVPQTVPAADLVAVFTQLQAENVACKMMQAIVLFDEYRGKGLQDNEKSLAFRVTLQDTQGTLQDEVVEAAMAAFIAAAAQTCGAKVRA
ncbi:MAG: phenylalanine--tRNA ligase subunit beta, partial [Burkholderiales bacterium]|nr:phenylalanine--tRNA ligase subunit beta [Burkholderiales bacterium]